MIKVVLQTVQLLDIAPSLSPKDTHAVGMFSDRGEVYNLQVTKKPGFSPKLTGGKPTFVKNPVSDPTHIQETGFFPKAHGWKTNFR